MIKRNVLVTPLAGVWIESLTVNLVSDSLHVTPLAGVWIESNWLFGGWNDFTESLPLRECGLKELVSF